MVVWYLKSFIQKKRREIKWKSIRNLSVTSVYVSILATAATVQERLTVQLAVGATQAQESLSAIATVNRGNYSLATLYSTPAESTATTNPNDNGSGNTGTGTTLGTGINAGIVTGINGAGTTGAGWNNSGCGLGLRTNGSDFGGRYYSSGSGYAHNRSSYPSTGEIENVTAGIFGGFLALLASLGIIKRKRSKK